MTDVLVTHSYFLRLDSKQWKAMQPYAPLGPLYAISVLREASLNVSFFDTMFAKSPQEVTSTLEKERPSVFVIYDDGFNYLTKMCLSNMRYAAFEMIALAKSFGCKIVVCSSDATDNYNLYLKKGANFVIMGEGELTLKELVTLLLCGEEMDYSLVEGIVFNKKDEVIYTTKRKVTTTLDLLPMPAWDMVDINEYKTRWMKTHGYFSLNVVTTRGCPYKCNWCAKPIYGNRYNVRSPENVVHELKFLINKFDPKHIWFCDDIFGLQPEWVREFAALVKSNNLKFRFKIQSRADLLIKKEIVGYLAEAGCDTVWLGAESGSQRILDAMDKGITIEQIHHATLLLRKYKIKPAFFLQFGYPGELIEDIGLTMKMVNNLLPDDIGVSVSYPLPGTLFYNKVKEELKIKTNWKDSDELALLFTNTYPPLFYKRLHRYVHKTYRKRQAVDLFKRLFHKSAKEDINYKRIIAYPYYYIMAEVERYRIKKIEPNVQSSF